MKTPDTKFTYKDQFYNLSRVIVQFINSTFDSVLGKGTEYALVFNFELTNGQHVSLTLYAPSNYVKVIEGVYDSESEKYTYRCMSDHDSCWRSDGVENFVNMYDENFERMSYNSIRKFVPTEEQIAEWRKMSNDRDYRYYNER